MNINHDDGHHHTVCASLPHPTLHQDLAGGPAFCTCAWLVVIVTDDGDACVGAEAAGFRGAAACTAGERNLAWRADRSRCGDAGAAAAAAAAAAE